MQADEALKSASVLISLTSAAAHASHLLRSIVLPCIDGASVRPSWGVGMYTILFMGFL